MKVTNKRERFVLALAALALAALALGGCARGAQSSGLPGSGSSQTPTSSPTTELNQLKQINQQNADDVQTLAEDEQNANQNAGNDEEILPAASAGPCTTLACVQRFGDQRIEERLAALERLKTAVQNHKRLTDEQRSAIINDANDNENGLKALKQKLDAETEISAALADVRNIYVQFRIFAVVIPRDRGEIVLFHEQNVITRMTNANQRISNLIQKDKDAGHDVTRLEALQADYNAKLQDATNHTNHAQGLIPSLIPANYPGTNETLKTYRADLKAAHDDIKAAAADLRQIYEILEADLDGGS